MTQKQAEYLAGFAGFDRREYTEAGARTEYNRRVKENLSRPISDEEMDELIGNYPDFPRNDE